MTLTVLVWEFSKSDFECSSPILAFKLKFFLNYQIMQRNYQVPTQLIEYIISLIRYICFPIEVNLPFIWIKFYFMWGMFFCCYLGPCLCNIKAIIGAVEGNIKGLFGMFSKREHYQFQSLAFGRVNINEALWCYFSWLSSMSSLHFQWYAHFQAIAWEPKLCWRSAWCMSY